MLFGITGASGAGKSYVSDMLRKKGFHIIDADKVGHNIIKSGGKAYYNIIDTFGDILLDNKEIDRRKLGRIVFSDKDKLEMLNKITHPQICEQIYKEAERYDICGVDGALLIECGIVCRPMIAVIADDDVRIKRIVQRDGIGRDDAVKRINSQKSNDFYKKECDYTIVNNGGDISGQINEIADRLRN